MSDHISGPRALADPIADITDLYAFPSPSHPQTLVLVMNTLPFAQPSDLFSDGLIYRFRIRPLTQIAPNGYRAPFDTSGRRTRHRLRLLRPDGRAGRGIPGAGGHLHHRVRADRSPSGSATRKAVPGPGSASSRACAGTRSSWTHPRR